MPDLNEIPDSTYIKIIDLKGEVDLTKIPSLSPASMQLMKMIFDKDVDIDDLINSIQRDINLSLEVIRVANSPRYRTSSPIDSVPKAIVYLGLDVIKTIVLSISVTGTMKSILSTECFNLVLSHSLATASAAQILAQHATDVSADTAFLTGLFLDLGLLVCASMYPKEFVDFVKEAKGNGIHIKTVIKEKLGINTNQLSFQIAEKWKLPQSILDNIDCHSQVRLKMKDSSIELDQLSIVSYLSMLAADVYFGSSTIVNIALFKYYFFVLLGKGNAAASEVLNLLSDEFNVTSKMLGLNLPSLTGFIEALKKSNNELLSINMTHEAMYVELYRSNSEILNLKQELSKKNKMLGKLVTLDPLTSLYNRRFFVKNLERLVSEARRYKNSLSLIMIGVDLFKEINEEHGHQAGDDVLTQVAKNIKNIFRDSDICTRYSTSEFMIILPQTSGNNALLAAEKIRVAIEQQSFRLTSLATPVTIGVTASFGLTSFGGEIDSLKDCIKECNKQLLLAIQHGGNVIRPKKF